MLHYPKINPIAFHIGPLEVHWYGIMYLLALLVHGSWVLVAISRQYIWQGSRSKSGSRSQISYFTVQLG